MYYRKGLKCCGMPENLADCRIRKTDTFVELELERWITRRGHEIDPLPLNSMLIEINMRFLLKIFGDLLLSGGHLKGLKTLHRSGDCYRANNKEDRMRMAVNLAAGTLEFECLAGLRLFNVDFPEFTFHVDIDYIQVYIELCYNFTFGIEAILHKIILSDARGMRLWISGWSILGWIINPFISLVTRYYKDSILNWIQDEVEDVINAGLYTFQFPYSFIAPPLFKPTEFNN